MCTSWVIIAIIVAFLVGLCVGAWAAGFDLFDDINL